MPSEMLQGMSAYTSQSDVKYFVINLPNAEERRHFMLEQAAHFGIHPDFVTAVAGRELTDADRSHFDRSKRDSTGSLKKQELRKLFDYEAELDVLVELFPRTQLTS